MPWAISHPTGGGVSKMVFLPLTPRDERHVGLVGKRAALLLVLSDQLRGLRIRGAAGVQGSLCASHWGRCE